MSEITRGKVALITGITGQDGSYLTEFLLEKGYIVHGIIRRSSSFNTARIDHLSAARDQGKLFLHYGDLTDCSSIIHIVTKIQPDEIYNLAAQSHVKVSFELSEYTGEVDGLGTLRLLEAIRTCKLEKKVRFYQASSSELFGKVRETPQKETTPFHPRSPYAVAKLYAYWIVQNFRESYDLFACNGILFNHESPRRGENFVTRKITRTVSEIATGSNKILELGNLNSKRDWGFAGDYVKAMWLMLQQKEPEDFVIATGKMYSVREFCEKSFKHVGIDIEWQGEGVNEIGKDKKTGNILIRVNPKFFRPAEVELLLGDATKAYEMLKWRPEVDLDALCKLMMESDLMWAKGEKAKKEARSQVMN